MTKRKLMFSQKLSCTRIILVFNFYIMTRIQIYAFYTVQNVMSLKNQLVSIYIYILF